MSKPRVVYAQFIAQKSHVLTVANLLDRFIREMNGLDTGKPVRELGPSHAYCLRRLSRSPIGAVPVRELTRHHVIEHAKARQEEGVSAATVNGDVGYLAGALKYAGSAWKDCDDISDAAVVAARPFLAKHNLIAKSQPRKRRPAQEEIDRLIAYFEQPAKKQVKGLISNMATITRWQVASGRRIGETCKLLWEDWNREQHTILVRKMKDPKNRNKQKVVALPEEAQAILIEMWPLRNPAEPRIFPRRARSVSAKYTLAKKALGIDGLRLHDSRRECYTRLVEDEGYSLEEAILVTGHETIAIAQRTYLAMKPENFRLGPKARRESVNTEAQPEIAPKASFEPIPEVSAPEHYIDLMALPEGHPMRDKPLTDIKAEYMHNNGTTWHPIEPGRPLARNTVNTLDGAWVQWCKWRAPQEKANVS